MKFFTFLFALCSCFMLQAQSYTVDFGTNQVLRGNQLQDRSETPAQLGDLFISGDVSGFDSRDYIAVTSSGVKVKDSDNEVKLMTNIMDVTKVEKLNFKIEASGIGSLDREGILHDWIDVHYYVDGVKYPVFNMGKANSGIPVGVAMNNVMTTDSETFQIEIGIRNTGDDEVYTIKSIQIDYELSEVEADVIVEPIMTQANQTVETLLLDVHPNPTTDKLFLTNPADYDLSKIEVLNLKGQLLRVESYPLNVSDYAAGMYFVRVKNVNGEYETAKFTVAR